VFAHQQKFAFEGDEALLPSRFPGGRQGLSLLLMIEIWSRKMPIVIRKIWEHDDKPSNSGG
jgi:hypothetical protein